MNKTRKKTISEVFAEGTPIDEAIKEAVRQAVLEHKRAGRSLPVWRDNKVVWIPPEEIPVSPSPESTA
ncbi:MAG: hypothetical protein SVS15_01255 [Thermodesulfobacteriota bacterium]|nr:hypothetical protein [Thermodesulfobacteriota bacterium]